MRAFVFLLLCLTLPARAERPDDIVRAEMQAQLVALELQINELKASGLSDQHPKVLTLEEHATELKKNITKLTPPEQETIILLEGISATSLTTGEKVQLAAMFKKGWRIQSLTAAGENKAYLWMQK